MHMGATPQQGLPTPQHRPGTPSTMPVAANGHEGFAGESGAAATPGELFFFCSACHSLLQLCSHDNGLEVVCRFSLPGQTVVVGRNSFWYSNE